MTEAELQDRILGLAGSLGLLSFHSTDSRRDIGKGFPDLVIVGPRGVLFAEEKDGGGQLKPDQVTWKYRLLAGGARWVLWRPRDWDTGRIEAELRRIA